MTDPHPTPWRVLNENHRFRGTRYHVQDASGADVCVLEVAEDKAAEETAGRIVEAVNTNTLSKEASCASQSSV